jgi:DNA polymerase III subunit gamma/tau
MAWYRLYRPQLVQELAITPVREYMLSLLKTGQYAHAYVFAGPKGTGKTSTARILARILNDPRNAELVLKRSGPLHEPDNKDTVLERIAQGRSQVVIEQDAASHRGIDDIRALSDHIAVVPTEGLVRVVILDEVHMLTTEAFNALLKMLEEPPERVVFVLATTEPHKIPATVQSRCEIVQFRQATAEEITQVLGMIAKREKIKLSKEVTTKLVQAAQGSFRDAVKYFESVVDDNQVDPLRLQQLTNGEEPGKELLRQLAQQDLTGVSQFWLEARQQGLNFTMLEQNVFRQLQDRLHRAIERQEPKATVRHITSLLTHLSERVGGYEPIEGLKLELACVEWCLQHDSAHTKEDSSGGNNSALPNKTQPQAKKTTATKPAIPEIKVQDTKVVTISSPGDDAQAILVPLKREEVEKKWSKLLLSLRTESQALESILRNAQLGEVTDQTIELIFEHKFHQEQLNSAKYVGLFRKGLEQCFTANTSFRCTLLTPHTEEVVPLQEDDDQLLQAVEAAVLSFEGNLLYSDPRTVSTE